MLHQFDTETLTSFLDGTVPAFYAMNESTEEAASKMPKRKNRLNNKRRRNERERQQRIAEEELTAHVGEEQIESQQSQQQIQSLESENVNTSAQNYKLPAAVFNLLKLHSVWEECAFDNRFNASEVNAALSKPGCLLSLIGLIKFNNQLAESFSSILPSLKLGGPIVQLLERVNDETDVLSPEFFQELYQMLREDRKSNAYSCLKLMIKLHGSVEVCENLHQLESTVLKRLDECQAQNLDSRATTQLANVSNQGVQNRVTMTLNHVDGYPAAYTGH